MRMSAIHLSKALIAASLPTWSSGLELNKVECHQQSNGHMVGVFLKRQTTEMNGINNNSPKQELCGTPQSRLKHAESVLLTDIR